MNMTFKRYADTLIMEKAMEMANNGYLTVSQIVYEIGAGDERNFRRRLKQIHGLTLSQFRKICDEQDEEESGQDNGDKK
jgi:methylphosphotriester-DNA--protein-cysteine methyltransferase